MKFGKNLREKTLKEWRFYAVDYKALKKSLKLEQQQDHDTPDTDEFFRLLTESEHKLDKFYHDKEKWAVGYIKTLEERVEALRDASSTVDTLTVSFSESEVTSLSSEDEAETEADSSTHVAVAVDDLDHTFLKLSKQGNHQIFGTKQEWLKQEYRKMGSSKKLEAFIYAKTSLTTFDRELSLLLEFLDLNKTPL
jgi:SPX domain protein involved in polyphosphate accumulation